MDYKTTILPHEIKAEENLLPEIFGLHFSFLGEKQTLFDYTAYMEENEIPPMDYKVFMRSAKYFIEVLAKHYQKKTSELFFQNGNGHILVASELVFIFLMYVNPEMLLYFNSLLSDVIADGVAYSNGFVYSMASNRLPSEVLNEIIKERERDAVGDE